MKMYIFPICGTSQFSIYAYIMYIYIYVYIYICVYIYGTTNTYFYVSQTVFYIPSILVSSFSPGSSSDLKKAGCWARSGKAQGG